MLSRIGKWCRLRRRYLAYFSLLLVLYFEMTARFGIPLALLKGLVKKNCDDINDSGTFCWSEKTRAFLIGAYFYGYTAQSLTAFIAQRLTGYFSTYRFWLLTAAIIEISFPVIATFSTELLIVSQAIRGLLAGIMVAFNFNYLANFSVGEESKTIITAFGVMANLGSGTGGLLAALIIESFTWRHYFYCIGAIYILGLVLHLLFVQTSPENSWYLLQEEKELIKKSISARKDQGSINNSTTSTDKDTSFLRNVFCRVYLLSFCFYQFGHGLVYYNILNVIPFYLNEVLGADPLLIAYLNTALFLLIVVSTLIFSVLYQKLDNIITWLECRMIFTVLPMICQVIFAIGMQYVDTITGGITILAFCAIGSSTMFTGGIVTINYELDPPNSSLTLSIWNSFGQMAGFVGPLLMATITTISKDTPNYDAVYKERWTQFFYVVAGVAVAASLAVVSAYFIKRDEWIPYRDKKETKK